jgi:hypothetical protein
MIMTSKMVFGLQHAPAREEISPPFTTAYRVNDIPSGFADLNGMRAGLKHVRSFYIMNSI